MGNSPGIRGDPDTARSGYARNESNCGDSPFSDLLKIIENNDDLLSISSLPMDEDNDIDDVEKTILGNDNQTMEFEYDRKCLTPIPLQYTSAIVASQQQQQQHQIKTYAFKTPTSSTSSCESLFVTANSISIETAPRRSEQHSPLNKFYKFTEDLTPVVSNNIRSIKRRRQSSVGFETCLQTPILNLIKTSDSKRYSLHRRSFSSGLLNKLQKLSKLSVSRCAQIDIESKPAVNCACQGDFVDGNCLKSFMEMSVSPAEFRGGGNQLVTSTPIIGKDVSFDRGIFSIARVKKVELHDLSPKVTEFNATPEMPTTTTHRCINNNNSRVPNGNQPHPHNQQTPKIFHQNASPITLTTTQMQQLKQQQQQQQSNTMTVSSTTTPEDGSVLKKICSFTVEQINSADHASATAAAVATRPTFVPEKLNFSAYERFEGQMLINWILSTLSKTTLADDRNASDIQMLIAHICTNLLVAGVMKQITDNYEPLKDAFCPNLMYRWTHTELQQNNQNVPKKIDTLETARLLNLKQETNTELRAESNSNCATAAICPHNEKLTTIKSNITTCGSITSIYARIKSSLIDIEAYARDNNINLTGTTSICEDLLAKEESKEDDANEKDCEVSMDCVDHAQIKLDLFESNHLTIGAKKDPKPCDSNYFITCWNSVSTQTTECSNDDANDNEQNKNVTIEISELMKERVESTSMISKIPPPPPMPSLFTIDSKPVAQTSESIPIPPPPLMSSMALTILNPVATPSSTSSSVHIPPPPPMPNLNLLIAANNIQSSTNSSSIPIPPPPPPPLLSSQTVSSPLPPILSNSASSFCPPPPPPMNGLSGPPPLPLPSAGNMWFKTDTFRKTALHPAKPMITLFWTRIVAPKPESNPTEEPIAVPKIAQKSELWQEIDETKLDNLDEFAELFSRQAVVPKKARESINKPIKNKYIKVLDNKRSQSVGIFAQSLHRLRLDFQKIEHSIYHCDTSIISLDLLQQLLEHKATPQELEMIKDAAAARNDVPLDGPEQFLLKLASISCASERIACILFQSEFDESSTLIARKVETVQHLCDFLMENDHLKCLFSIILTLGNYMNGGNRLRGQADGFGLDVLGKLRDVKSKDKKVTLLHFIVKTYIHKYRHNGLQLHEIVFPVPDVADINRALTIDFVELNEQINHLRQKLADFVRKMELVIRMSTEANVQPFKDQSKSFVAMATKRIESQIDRLNASKVIFRKTLNFYKYIPKSGTLDECTPGQFFELWSSFVVDFRDIWKKECETLHKVKSVAAPPPKTPNEKCLGKGKSKSSGLRMRRINQI